MKILSLDAHQFRNLSIGSPIVVPPAPLIAIVAPNASGKTNFLEAIVILLRGKSFRARNSDCVQWGKDNFVVHGSVDYGEGNVGLSVQYHTPNKTMHITENNAPVSPITFFGHYPLILFLPEDAALFSRGPVGRRNFLNTSLASSHNYLASVVQYHRALKQRNAALKYATSMSDILPWTDLLEQHARVVWTHRTVFTDYLASQVPDIYASIFHEKLALTLSFVPGTPNIESFRETLVQSWNVEHRYQYTLYGPHRDDIEVRSGGIPVYAALSRGQMRGLTIACKVAAYAFMKQLLNQEPLLIFDEILSELDVDRKRRLLEYIPSSQTFMTCSALPDGVARRSETAVIDMRQFV